MRALTLQFYGMHKTKSISQYTSTAGVAEKFQIFQGNCFWQWEWIWKIFEETLFLSRQDETLHLMVMVMFGILWCLLVVFGFLWCP